MGGGKLHENASVVKAEVLENAVVLTTFTVVRKDPPKCNVSGGECRAVSGDASTNRDVGAKEEAERPFSPS